MQPDLPLVVPPGLDYLLLPPYPPAVPDTLGGLLLDLLDVVLGFVLHVFGG